MVVAADIVQEDMNDRTRVPTMHMARECHITPFSEVVLRTGYKLFSENDPGVPFTGTDYQNGTVQTGDCLF